MQSVRFIFNKPIVFEPKCNNIELSQRIVFQVGRSLFVAGFQRTTDWICSWVSRTRYTLWPHLQLLPSGDDTSCVSLPAVTSLSIWTMSEGHGLSLVPHAELDSCLLYSSSCSITDSLHLGRWWLHTTQPSSRSTSTAMSEALRGIPTKHFEPQPNLIRYTRSPGITHHCHTCWSWAFFWISWFTWTWFLTTGCCWTLTWLSPLSLASLGILAL